MKRIDAHVHIYPPEIEREKERISKKEPWFEGMINSKVHKWGTAEELVSHMDEHGIVSSLVTGFAFRDQGLCRIMNDYVLDSAKKYRGRILPLAVVSPCAKGAADEILRCAELGAAGVGELFPDGQELDISDKGQTWRMVGACMEAGMFILFHTAEQVGHQYKGKGHTGAEKAAAFCMNHPQIKVVFAHFGGGLWAYESMPEMKLALSNAYYDTAAWPWLYSHKVIDGIFSSGAGSKFLFGSDWPILKYPRYEKLISLSSLSEEQKEMLLYRNAGSLFSQRDHNRNI
ncbi:MAG: amidohydrolase family protein [Synergistaceae bacterium]|nr:amidohydrolase family protein [Synergistaceae bacterium]